MSTLKKRLARAWKVILNDLPPPRIIEAPLPDPRDSLRYIYLGPDLALTSLLSGNMMFVDPQDEQISVPIIRDGTWEHWLLEVVLSLVKPGDHVVEVGANIGFYTVAMARQIGPTGRLTTFEANARLAGLVRRSLNLNAVLDRCTIVNKAAWNTVGELEFVTSRRFSGGGYVGAGFDDLHEDSVRTVVQTMPIDDVIDGRVDFMRLDAEGSEPFILRGAQEVLTRNPDIVICMEWCLEQLASRVDVPEFVDWLYGLGFTSWFVELDASLTPLTAAELVTSRTGDIVLSRRPLERRQPIAD